MITRSAYDNFIKQVLEWKKLLGYINKSQIVVNCQNNQSFDKKISSTKCVFLSVKRTENKNMECG